jgi:hypothetical protein
MSAQNTASSSCAGTKNCTCRLCEHAAASVTDTPFAAKQAHRRQDWLGGVVPLSGAAVWL